MSLEKQLRESLFSAEPLSVERQQRFREEIAQIAEPRLPRSHRVYYLVGLISSAIGFPGALCGVVLDREHRWTWAFMLLATAASAGWYLHILRRGAEPLRIMQGMSKVLTGGSSVAAGFLIYRGLQNPSLAGVLWALAGILAFMLMSFINLWNRMLMTERSVREQVLRVEYRLADLASRLPGAGKLPGPGKM